MIDIKKEFDEIYEETYNLIYKFIVSKTDQLENVEDIIQEVYVSFYKTISKKGLNYIENNLAYLYKLSRSELFKYYSLKNKFKFIFNISSNDETFDYIENIPDDCIIEDLVIESEQAEAVWNIIRTEDVLTGKIMALYFQNDMKISEIAEYLKINESTVKNRIYRTIDKVKKQLGGNDYNEN